MLLGATQNTGSSSCMATRQEDPSGYSSLDLVHNRRTAIHYNACRKINPVNSIAAYISIQPSYILCHQNGYIQVSGGLVIPQPGQSFVNANAVSVGSSIVKCGPTYGDKKYQINSYLCLAVKSMPFVTPMYMHFSRSPNFVLSNQALGFREDAGEGLQSR